jgi:hypothetical protein
MFLEGKSQGGYDSFPTPLERKHRSEDGADGQYGAADGDD